MAVAERSWKALRPRNLAASVIGLAAAIGLLYYGRVFLITLCAAGILAFILEPFVGLLMRVRLPRSVASFLVCSAAICVVYLVGLGVYTEGAGLVEDLPKYTQRINDITDQVLLKVETLERKAVELVVPKRFREQAQPPAPAAPKPPAPRRSRSRVVEPIIPPPPIGVPWPSTIIPEVRIRPERPPLVDFVYSHLASVYQVLLMASFVPFLVYFMLSWSDHIHRRFLQIFDESARIVAAKSLNGIAAMVRAFVVGNFMLGLLLAVISTIVVWSWSLPYPMLIGPLSALLSLIPYIGLPLALLPPFFGALAVYSAMTPYLIMLSTIAVLHLLAMNLLYPKIVGPRVHLNPLVVTIALMFWSVLWGAAGLVLAIPLTAGIKAVCDNVEKLQPYGRLMGD